MTATLLVFATVWQTGCSKPSVPKSTSPAVSDKQPATRHEVKKTTLPTTDAEQPTNKHSPGSLQLSESDLARSSWENPFLPRLWSNDGWQINEDSMICESNIGQSATFLRPYRNVVIECRFSRSNKNATATEDDSPIEFEIRLLNRDSNRWVSLSLSPADITLTESVDGANANVRPIRETARTTGDDSSEVAVRLTLTPNRLLVSVDGQMKINVTRPGPIMMADCLAQFVVPKADIELSDLRFEGD